METAPSSQTALPFQACALDQEKAAPGRLTRQEKLTFSLLFVGYLGYYLTRKNITVASISMKDLGLLTLPQIAYLTSLGTLSYAIGKFVNGFLADWIGGKRVFLLGMFGSVAATVLFGVSSTYGFFLLFWAVNSYFLSMGWSGLIKISSHWFMRRKRGTLIGWMSLTYQMGSSLSKSLTALLMGCSLLVWRGLFFVPAAMLMIVAFVNLFLLRERPQRSETVGWEGATAGPMPLGGAAVSPMQESPRREKVAGRVSGRSWARLLKSPPFLLILWGSAALTLIRTFFDDFIALWLSGSGLEATTAGYVSAIFPLGGMIGTVMMGWLSDRVGKGNRGPFMILSCVFLGFLLFLSAYFPKNSAPLSSVFFFSAGFFLYGGYSILAGVSAIDFGGTVAPSTAAGIIDGVGYLAGAGAGLLVARMESAGDWEALVFQFAILTLVIAITLLPLWKRYPTKSILE